MLLRDTDWVRFVPGRDFVGTRTISYRAWDQTAGTPGQYAAYTKTQNSYSPDRTRPNPNAKTAQRRLRHRRLSPAQPGPSHRRGIHMS